MDKGVFAPVVRASFNFSLCKKKKDYVLAI